VSPVAISADKRFRRAHVKPARTRRGWRAMVRRAVLSALTVGALLYSASYVSAILAQAQVLRVNRIVVHGNERLSDGDVLAVLSGLRGESLIWTDLNGWRYRLLASPWIRDAALRRVLPSTVEIVVAEREPVGIGRIGGAMYLIDDRGAIIDEFGPQYSEFDLPIVDGLALPEGANVLSNERRGELASRVIAALRTNPVIFGRLSQVDVHDLHNASVMLSDDPTVIQLGEQDFLSRLRLYLEMAPALHERMADIESVDLRFEGRIYARPTGKRVKAGMLARRAKP
jgi:cell division protein FtsQ